jgi:hypothetical protein
MSQSSDRLVSADDREPSAEAVDPIDPPLGEGDDDPLILWFLSLTPMQRLKAAQGFADSVRLLRNGRPA